MSVPFVRINRQQRILGLVEVRNVLHVRRADQPPIEIVRPRVIRTLNALDEAAFGLLAEARAAVAAHVEQRVNRAR